MMRLENLLFRMTSIGDTLRRERQRRHLEIPQIAGELRISSRFLEAMEQDEFAKLPGGVFTRSFVRQYGDFLGPRWGGTGGRDGSRGSPGTRDSRAFP